MTCRSRYSIIFLGGGGCLRSPVTSSIGVLVFLSTSLSTTKKWLHLTHLTNRDEETNVPTCVHGSPHLGQVMVILFLFGGSLPVVPSPPSVPVGGGVVGGSFDTLLHTTVTWKARFCGLYGSLEFALL